MELYVVAGQHHLAIDTLLDPYPAVVATLLLGVEVEHRLRGFAIGRDVEVAIINEAVQAGTVIDGYLNVNSIDTTGRNHPVVAIFHLVAGVYHCG